MSTDTYMQKDINIPMERLSAMSQEDGGRAVLRVHVYYHRDARKRGIKLSINRCVIRGAFTSYDVMNKYNGLLHLADLPRKNKKAGEAWAATVAEKMDEIVKIAMASDEPDWQAVFDVLEGREAA